MKKLSVGDLRWDLEKNRRRLCIGVKTSGPASNPPAAGSAKTFLPRWKAFHGRGVFFSAEKIKVPDEKIFHGISVAGLRKNFGRDSASERRHGAARKKLAGSAIGRGRRPTREILGLKKKSSLQGLAGEVLTICKRGCFASEDWRGVNVAEHGFGTSRFAVIVVTGARRAPAPSERLRR